MFSLIENSQRRLSENIGFLYYSMQNLDIQSKMPKARNFSYFHIGFLHDLGTSKCMREYVVQSQHTDEETKAHREEATCPKLCRVLEETRSHYNIMSFLISLLLWTQSGWKERHYGRGWNGPRQGRMLFQLPIAVYQTTTILRT